MLKHLQPRKSKVSKVRDLTRGCDEWNLAKARGERAHIMGTRLSSHKHHGSWRTFRWTLCLNWHRWWPLVVLRSFQPTVGIPQRSVVVCRERWYVRIICIVVEHIVHKSMPRFESLLSMLIE